MLELGLNRRSPSLVTVMVILKTLKTSPQKSIFKHVEIQR